MGQREEHVLNVLLCICDDAEVLFKLHPGLQFKIVPGGSKAESLKLSCLTKTT